MPFKLRHHSRFPISSPVRYEVRLRDGSGTVMNLSPRGGESTAMSRCNIGDGCSMKVRLDARNWVALSAGIVRWAHEDECGIETLVMNDESQEQLSEYIQERVKAL